MLLRSGRHRFATVTTAAPPTLTGADSTATTPVPSVSVTVLGAMLPRLVVRKTVPAGTPAPVASYAATDTKDAPPPQLREAGAIETVRFVAGPARELLGGLSASKAPIIKALVPQRALFMGPACTFFLALRWRLH